MLTKPHCSPQEEEEGQGAGCGQHSLTESFEGCLHPVTPSQATMKILQLLLSWGEFGWSLVCWYICILTGCAGKQFCHRNMARVLSAGIHAVVLRCKQGRGSVTGFLPSLQSHPCRWHLLGMRKKQPQGCSCLWPGLMEDCSRLVWKSVGCLYGNSLHISITSVCGCRQGLPLSKSHPQPGQAAIWPSCRPEGHGHPSREGQPSWVGFLC